MNLYYISWWYHQYIIILLITVHLIHNKRRTKDKRYRFEYVRKKEIVVAGINIMDSQLS